MNSVRDLLLLLASYNNNNYYYYYYCFVVLARDFPPPCEWRDHLQASGLPKKNTVKPARFPSVIRESSEVAPIVKLNPAIALGRSPIQLGTRTPPKLTPSAFGD